MYPPIHLHQAVHGRLEYTLLSIESVATHTHYPNVQWTVSDIANHPAISDHLQRLHKAYGFELNVYKENLGQWHACEKAWKTSPCPLLTHLQNDILVPHGWLYALQEAKEIFRSFLVGAWHFPVSDLRPPDEQLPQGLGLYHTTHLPGTCFLLARHDWQQFAPIYRGHKIYGFTEFQARANKNGAKIAYAYPPIKIIHMDQGDYAHSLRETQYKTYTDEIFQLRHSKPRPPGIYP